MIVDGSASLEILAAFDHWPIPLDDDLGVRPDFPNALVPQTQMGGEHSQLEIELSTLLSTHVKPFDSLSPNALNAVNFVLHCLRKFHIRTPRTIDGGCQIVSFSPFCHRQH